MIRNRKQIPYIGIFDQMNQFFYINIYRSQFIQRKIKNKYKLGIFFTLLTDTESTKY